MTLVLFCAAVFSALFCAKDSSNFPINFPVVPFGVVTRRINFEILNGFSLAVVPRAVDYNYYTSPVHESKQFIIGNLRKPKTTKIWLFLLLKTVETDLLHPSVRVIVCERTPPLEWSRERGKIVKFQFIPFASFRLSRLLCLHFTAPAAAAVAAHNLWPFVDMIIEHFSCFCGLRSATSPPGLWIINHKVRFGPVL